MRIFSVRKYVQNQYVAGLSAGLTVMVSGGTFVWESPILHLLDKEIYEDVLIPMTKSQITLMISLIEIGGLFAPFPIGFLADFYGRKLSIAIAGPFIVIGWAMIFLTRDVICLYIVRLLHGFAVGTLYTAVPIYLAEVAEAKVRGGLTALFQIMWFAGFLCQYIIGSFLSYDKSAIVNIIFSTIVFSFFFVVQPESPYFLMMKKRDEKAHKSVMLLRGKSNLNDVEHEMKMIRDCIDVEMKNQMKWSDLFKLTKIDYKVLFVVQMMGALRLACGTDAISSYIGEILHSAHWKDVPENMIMIIYGAVSIAFIIIATFSVDSVGRRPLLIFSCLGTAISNFCLGCFFLFDPKEEGSILYSLNVQWIPAAALISYTILFSLGLGPVTQTIQSELCPTNIRALGSVVANYAIGIVAFSTLYYYEINVSLFGICSNFFLYSGICFAGAIFTYFCVPETKGKTFLEIREFFYKKTDTITLNTRL